jgi:hypothetical protein
VIDLTVDRPLRRAVPKHFHYLAVEWGGDGSGSGTGAIGAAHAVEDERSVGPDFCLDVVAGMLGEDPMRMRRGATRDRDRDRPRREKDEAEEAKERKVIAEFKELWGPFDWTNYIMSPAEETAPIDDDAHQ